MANGNEPSGAGLVVLTGLSIAAVVGLYAADVIPRRSGPALSHDVAWPSWQSSPSVDRSYDTAPTPQVVQGQSAPAPQDSAPTSDRYPQYPAQGGYPQQQQQPAQQQQQLYPNQQQGYPQQQQPASDNYPQDVPVEGAPPTQQQYQQPSQPNGQPY